MAPQRKLSADAGKLFGEDCISANSAEAICLILSAVEQETGPGLSLTNFHNIVKLDDHIGNLKLSLFLHTLFLIPVRKWKIVENYCVLWILTAKLHRKSISPKFRHENIKLLGQVKMFSSVLNLPSCRARLNMTP